jgi:hypothetical protein
MPPAPGSLAHGTLWRVFPWNAGARDGEPYSVRSVAPAHRQNYGRFDLGGRPLVLYLAETPAHGVAEVLRGLKRNPATPFDPSRHRLAEDDLRGSGHPRALVQARLPAAIADRVPDLAEGAALARFGVRADHLSTGVRALSRKAARQIYAHGDAIPGFTWWSAFGGDWHVTLLFLDRISLDEIEFGTPEILTLGHPAVQEAARELNLDIDPPR